MHIKRYISVDTVKIKTDFTVIIVLKMILSCSAPTTDIINYDDVSNHYWVCSQLVKTDTPKIYPMVICLHIIASRIQ